MKRALMVGCLVGLLGCSTGSRVKRSSKPSFSCEVQGFVPEPRYRADVPMGRLEVEKLAPAPAPAAPPTEKPPEEDQEPSSRKKPRFPAARLRVAAEAVPLGTLMAAVSRELRLGILVTPRLVDLRVSLALPDVTTEGLFRLLHSHYDLAAEASENGVIVIEDRLEVFHRRYEPPEALIRVVPVSGLPAADVASVYCKLLVGQYGSAHVVGNKLIVKGEQRAQERLDLLIRTLKDPKKAQASSDQAPSP